MAFKGDEYHELCILKTSEVVTHRCSVKKVFLEIQKIHRKTHVPESLFLTKLQALGF